MVEQTNQVGEVWIVYGVRRAGGRREALSAWLFEDDATAEAGRLEDAEAAKEDRYYSSFAPEHLDVFNTVDVP